MAKELLNEAERFLVEHWGEARLLEESMESVRTKYKEVFERIIEAVTEAHPELDAHRSAPTQFWGSGSIGFGRKSWPEGGSNWPSGLWVSNLRLEILTADDSDPPYASIWVPKRKVNLLDYEASRVAVERAAKALLSTEELKHTVKAEPSEEVLLYFSGPPKGELLGALCKADGQGFVEMFVAQFELMARFVPVLDKVFQECLRKE